MSSSTPQTIPGDEPVYVQNTDPSNQEILPPKSKKIKQSRKLDSRGRPVEKVDQRLKKLSKKRKKRLQGIVEAKERLDRRGELFASLSQLRLPVPEDSGDLKSKSHARGLRKGKLNILSGQNKLDPVENPSTNEDWHSGVHVQTDESDVDEGGGDESGKGEERGGELVGQGDSSVQIKTEQLGPDIEVMQESSTCSDDIMIVDQEQPSTSQDNEKTADRKSPEVHSIKREKAIFVPVHRSKEIQDARLKLPILAEEQTIVEAINENQVVILCGETGSGKTTQVPQFLYEAGYATEKNGKMIGITEPRRVAATSMSRRVAEEMNLDSDVVSYQIRFEGNCTDQTKIKFMTDGILLKEMQSDIILSKYSVVIIDEAHERSVYSDILLGLLSRIVPLRWSRNDPLHLIVMSATLRVDDFTQPRLFKSAPKTICVEARQHPVTIYFNRRTKGDYLEEAYRRICDIHRKLPDGGILVFVSGRKEVHDLINKLRKAFPNGMSKHESAASNSDNDEAADVILEKSLQRGKKLRKSLRNAPKIELERKAKRRKRKSTNADRCQEIVENDCDIDIAIESEDLLECGVADDLSGSIDDANSELVPEDQGDYMDAESVPFEARAPLHCLPLYSLLPGHLQQRVFQPPPTGSRLCVVATNVAETSLTIPGVKYVVDCGKAKAVQYDPVTGVRRFTITWTSQASALQRAGRAGRTAPGHCYRLFSSAVFANEFQQFSAPEICCKPVDELLLQMKAMHIVKVHNFPFPTPPPKESLEAAESRLAFGCAIYSGCSNEVCDSVGLRPAAVGEARRLERQLASGVAAGARGSRLPGEGVDKLPPPAGAELRMLAQCVLAALAENVAVRSDVACDGESQETDATSYRISNMKDPVFIHVASCLAKERPEFVIYTEIVDSAGKKCMTTLCRVERSWVPIYAQAYCDFGDILSDAAPKYDAETDKIVALTSCKFRGCAMPPAWKEHPMDINYYKYFAFALLKGQVYTRMIDFASKMLVQPEILFKKWAESNERVKSLLDALVANDVCSKSGLDKLWRDADNMSNRMFLYKEISRWYPESLHDDLLADWPLVD